MIGLGIKKKKTNIISQVKSAGCYISIDLGGFVVIGGEQPSLDLLLKKLPKKEHYPFQLPYHAAFHTPLLKSISERAFNLISPKNFQKPSVPIIDGKGNIKVLNRNKKSFIANKIAEVVLDKLLIDDRNFN